MKIVQESSYTSPRFTENTPLLDSVDIDSDQATQHEAAPPDEDEELDPAVGHEVRILYLLAVLTGMMLTLTTPMLLSYFIYIGYSTSKNVTFFIIISAIETAVPVAGHAALGSLTSRLGVRRTISLTATLTLGSFCILAYARSNRCIFAVAYVIHTLARSIRIARTVRMAEIVPANFRTTNMSIHMFSSLLGCSLGPMVWIFCSQFEGDYKIFSSLYLNRFTLNYSSGGLLCILIAITSWYGLGDSVSSSPPQLDGSMSGDIPPEDNADEAPLLVSSSLASGVVDDEHLNDDDDLFLSLSLSDGSLHRVNAKTYQRNTSRYFLFLMFSVAGTTGLVMVAFQPILIDDYNVSGKQIGVIYTCVLIFGLIPPLLVAFLSKYLQDRQIMLIGLLIKLTGIILYLPISISALGIDGNIAEWRVIVGFILVCKGSMFFWASGMSLFTILLGPMSNGTLLGILSSAAQIGPALAQLFLAQWTIRLFGSFYYGALAVPLLASIVLVIWPSRWKRLDPDDEFTKVLLRQYEIVETKRKGNNAE